MNLRRLAPLLLAAAAQPAVGQVPAQDANVQDLAPVQVTAPRLRMDDIYRSKPPPRTAPTVFDRAWREPVNLKKIGDEGGVVPILVRHASRQVTRAARSLPGWKGPDQPARARAAPLDEAQLLRAVQAHEAQEAQEAAPR